MLVVLDGHNRLEITRELKQETGVQPVLPVAKTKSSKEIPDLESAQLWVMANQLRRRNLTDASRVNLAAKFYRAEADRRRRIAAADREENKRAQGDNLTQTAQLTCEPNTEKELPQHLRTEVAKQFGVTEREVRKELDVIKQQEERDRMATAAAPALT